MLARRDGHPRYVAPQISHEIDIVKRGNRAFPEITDKAFSRFENRISVA
jgi:hypothetical protein